MNDQLQVLQSKITNIIYNPFVNLKDQIKVAKSLIAKQDEFEAELARLNAAMEELELLEDLPHGNLERIKGFNKIKTRMLKLIKELQQKTA
jgi:hypothetical protein